MLIDGQMLDVFTRCNCPMLAMRAISAVCYHGSYRPIRSTAIAKSRRHAGEQQNRFEYTFAAEDFQMDEPKFWASLEYRLCREFEGLPYRGHKFLWCDGLEPRVYILSGPTPRITGKAWIGSGSQLAEWEFALLLPGPVGSREEIDWAALHPAGNVTRWLAIDDCRRYLEIEPAVAVCDLAKRDIASERNQR